MQNQINQNVKSAFENNGYSLIRNIINDDLIIELKRYVLQTLEMFATEIDVDYSRYIFCTGRWDSSSKLFKKSKFLALLEVLKEKIQLVLGQSVDLAKYNIIYKSEYIIDRVPLHQDISYSFNSPYSFSLWLALDEVIEDSGEVVVIPKSHKWKISPAVDFWSPFYNDNKWYKHQNNLQKIYLNAGDGLIFDSSLWHGSIENKKKTSRLAFVTRWTFKNAEFPIIANPISKPFGMWNCFEKTLSALSKGRQESGFDNSSYVNLINTHIEKLRYNCKKKRPYSQMDAIHSLENLIILHKASHIHGAGDLCGKIYKGLWKNYLSYL